MTYVVQTNKLTKTIGEKNLVTNVSMHVKKGEIYGFLGPNGAGKTTVMKLLTNLWKPTEGSIELFGEKLTSTSYEVLKRMGCMIEFPTFYEHLSGRENLALHCEYMGYYNTGSIENAMELLGLNNTGKKSVREYSLGMKQRLGLARAVLCKPELLILDEPTNGLDPAGIKQIRDLLRMLCTEYDITIIVSSHILSEIESIADTIGVINRGVLVQEIAMQEITERSLAYIELNVVDTRKASYVLSDKIGIDNFKIVEDRIIRIYDGNISVQELSKALALHDVEMTAIGTKSESLEEYFLKLTWKKNNIGKYIRNAVILAIILCTFLFALAYLGIANDPDTGVPDAAPGNEMISSSIELFTGMSFLVFTGVMLASFIVTAYKNKTMNLMFSYPIRRQKILVSQMLAVWIFNLIALILTKLLVYGCVLVGSLFMKSAFLLDFNMASASFYVQLILKSIVMVSMSFIALFIGLAMKSSKATIISSFLLIFLTQANIGDFTLKDNLVFPVILTGISVVFAVLSVCHAETKDLM